MRFIPLGAIEFPKLPEKSLSQEEFDHKVWEIFYIINDIFEGFEDGVVNVDCFKYADDYDPNVEYDPDFEITAANKDKIEKYIVSLFLLLYGEADRDKHYFEYGNLLGYRLNYKKRLTRLIGGTFRAVDESERTFYFRELNFYKARMEGGNYSVDGLKELLSKCRIAQPNYKKTSRFGLDILNEIQTSDIAIYNYLIENREELCVLDNVNYAAAMSLAESINKLQCFSDKLTPDVLLSVVQEHNLPRGVEKLVWIKSHVMLWDLMGEFMGNPKPKLLRRCFKIVKNGKEVAIKSNENTNEPCEEIKAIQNSPEYLAICQK